ncbi:MAG: hypothetical protein ACYDCI_00290 [Candidatus Limnocylindrales bacterium]
MSDNTPAPAPDVDETDDEIEPPDDLVEAIDIETQKRLWIRTLIPFLAQRKGAGDDSARVQYALDKAAIAACEKIARLCSD